MPRKPAHLVSSTLLFAFTLACQAGEHGATAHSPAAHEHAHHLAMLQRQDYRRTTQRYSIPSVVLTDQRGEKVPLNELLSADRPVLLQFIFTTCTTICPVLSASLAAAREGLDSVRPGYRLVSISIDPEEDTPAVLRGYANRFHAGEDWYFLTGSKQDIARVQKAFDAWYPGNNKMYHRPYTYLRVAPGAPWARLDGLLGTRALVDEYRALLATDAHPRLTQAEEPVPARPAGAPTAYSGSDGQ